MPAADGHVAPATPTAAVACAHCGELSVAAVVDGSGGERRTYCCAGCAQAARWIADSGLGDYYRWRRVPGTRIGAVQDFRGWDRADILDAHGAIDGDTRTIRFAVSGMHCAACAWLVDKALRREPGVVDVSANALEGRVRLAWRPSEVALSSLLARVAGLGFLPSLPASPQRDAERRRENRQRLVGLGIAGLGTLQAMMFSEALYLDVDGSMPLATRDAFRWLTAAMSAPVVFYAGMPFLRGMWRELRLRLPGMDTLIGSGVLLAWSGSLVETLRGGPQVWFDAAVMFVLFLLAARHLEAALRESGEARLDALAGAQPALALREIDGGLETVPSRELRVGDVVHVGRGAALPCDGVLLDAAAHLDDALLTGESTPRRRVAGDTLLAGSLVYADGLRLRASAVGAATTLSQLARRVDALRGQRPPQVDRAATLARRVVGLTLLLALGSGLAWWSIDPARAFPIALAVLVATCPCALALAVPAAIARAQSRLARHGVLVLGAGALSRLAAVDTVVFDKTGTLTEGRPAVLDVQPFGGLDAAQATALAARLEAAVEHPLARAFGPALGLPAEAVRVHRGAGVEGQLDDATWRIGRAAFACGGDDDGAVWLSRDGVAQARFVVDDAPRADAAEALAALSAEGLRVAVLSGDAPARVAALLSRLGTSATVDGRGGLAPQRKREALRAMQAAGRRVLVVGDGLNDAEMLAAADVSVAMAEGAALAQRQADLVLGGSRLMTIVEARRIARQAQAVIAQNLGWAVAYNLAVLPAAALGWIGPGLAALGMALSSLAVTANAWRIGAERRP